MNRSWLLTWTFRVVSVTGTQTLVQLLNGFVAFIIIRTLPKEQFAWFTLASGMATVLNSLNDGGIASAVTAHGGPVCHDRTRFSALLHAALGTLQRTATLAAAVVAPLLAWLLWQREAPPFFVFVSVALVVGPQWLATRTVVLGTVNRLQARVRQLQMLELTGAFTRALLTIVPAALGCVSLPIALGAVAASIAVQALLVRRQVLPFIDPVTPPALQVPFDALIRGTLRRTYPNVVFGCVQAQIATALLAVFGTTSQVADLGALARLGFFINLIGAPIGHLFAPAFARCTSLPRLRILFLGVIGGYLLLLALFLLLVHNQAGFILSLFGPNYGHLHAELLLTAASLSVHLVNQTFWALNFSRGWIRWVWLNIPLSLFGQVVSALLLPINTVRGAILLSLLSAMPALLLGVSVVYAHLRSSSSLSPDSTPTS